MVSGMTLQTQHGLTDLEQIAVHRSMGGMALQATLADGNVLIGKRALQLGMALKAKLVEIVGAQVVGSSAAVRIMAIRAAHLRFANRVVIGKVPFRRLLSVAADARLVLLAARVELRLLRMNAMAIDAANVMPLMRAGEPVL